MSKRLGYTIENAGSSFTSSTISNLRATNVTSASLQVFSSTFPAIRLQTSNPFVNAIEFDSTLTGQTGGKLYRIMGTHQDAAEGQGNFVIQNVTNNINAFTIQNNGDIGIRSTIPRENLEVVGSSSTTGVMLYSGLNDGGVNNLFFNHTHNSATFRKVVLKSQALGDAQSARAHFGICVNTSADSSNATFADAKLFIHGSSGNVGIGATVPNYALQVSGDIYASGDIISFSDARLKTNIETIDNALDKLKELRGVYYTHTETQKRGIGLIAQEAQQIIPEVVIERGQEFLGVAYGNVVGMLVQAIKELSEKVENLEKQLE
jgi:hypothetical protein